MVCVCRLNYGRGLDYGYVQYMCCVRSCMHACITQQEDLSHHCITLFSSYGAYPYYGYSSPYYNADEEGRILTLQTHRGLCDIHTIRLIIA
jgi:hypothetical protein